MKIIAIDGPSGSGKGTVAKEVARRLGYTYIDTGAMYRCVALKVIENNIDIKDTTKIVNILKNINITLTNDGKCYIDNIDVSDDIRSIKVTSLVSKISLIVPLREVMKEKQREYSKKDNIVMEGRDITTEVFKDADFKFYLDATLDVRANRRYNQNKEKCINSSLEEIKESLKERDHDDMTREVGALKRTNDQIYINSDNLTIEEVINKIMEMIK